MRLRLSITAVAALLGFSALASARDLTVISWGGNFQDAQRIAYFAPFAAATGHKVVDQAWMAASAR